MSLSVFITGGSEGLGRALAYKYQSQGHRVGICARDINKLNEISDEIKKYQADVTDQKKMLEVIHDFSKDGLDLVIANAGLSYHQKKKVPDFDISRQIINVNINGVLNTFEPALKKMLEQKSGRLVAISSIAALAGFPGVSAYSGSKSAVMKICETYAIDLYDFGIKVTCICPGFIKTPLTDKNPHPMPFMISAQKAADIIYDNIKKGKELVFFPFAFTFVIRVLSILPKPIFRFLMRQSLFNFSLKE